MQVPDYGPYLQLQSLVENPCCSCMVRPYSCNPLYGESLLQLVWSVLTAAIPYMENPCCSLCGPPSQTNSLAPGWSGTFPNSTALIPPAAIVDLVLEVSGEVLAFTAANPVETPLLQL